MMWTLRSLVLALAACSVFPSCGTEAIRAAEACAGRDLTNVCPAGTRPRLDTEASAQCEGGAEVEVIRQQGAISGACTSVGRCNVFCEADPEFSCEFGIQSISRDAVICATQSVASGCGNGVCDLGENADNCRIDCSGVCIQGQQRCNGAGREVCNLQGRWEAVSCVDGERCVESNEQTACVRSDFALQMQHAVLPEAVRTQAIATGPVARQTTPVQTASAGRTTTAQTAAVRRTTPQRTQPQAATRAVGEAFDCASTFQCMRLSPGFLPDPLSVRGRSGGTNRYSECSGYFAAANSPDHILYLENEFAYLQIGLISGAPIGSTLMVASLDGSGSVFCSQPQGGTPRLERGFRRGSYGVWVGAQASGVYENYTLYATELR